MDNPVNVYWSKRLNEVREALEANSFEVHMAETAAEAGRLVLDRLIPDGVQVSFGGSGTINECGVYEALKNSDRHDVIDTMDKNLSWEEKIETRRQALLCDVFLCSTNALVEDGRLVNLDMLGNRVGAIGFGPKSVILLVGRNKIVPDMEEAVSRIKEYSAPTNAIRLDMKTPCIKTGRCSDCSSPERICNVWTVHEKSCPAKRIKIVLINEDLGL